MRGLCQLVSSCRAHRGAPTLSVSDFQLASWLRAVRCLALARAAAAGVECQVSRAAERQALELGCWCRESSARLGVELVSGWRVSAPEWLVSSRKSNWCRVSSTMHGSEQVTSSRCQESGAAFMVPLVPLALV